MYLPFQIMSDIIDCKFPIQQFQIKCDDI